MLINKNDTVLFQGDSITDWGRTSLWRINDKHTKYESSDDVGNHGIGYVSSIIQQFNALYPELNVNFINRGVGGNRTKDLVQRWQKDCIDLKPNVVSILIGINDTWRRYDANDPTTIEQFEKNYRIMLDMIKENLPDTKIIIMEPCLMPTTEDKRLWREDLDEKIQVVRKLSYEYKTEFIPLDGIFHQACNKASYEFFTTDGIHTSYNGSALIAEHWLKCVGAR